MDLASASPRRSRSASVANASPMVTATAGTSTIHPSVLRMERSMLGSVKTNLKFSRPTKFCPRESLKADQDRVDHRIDQEDAQDDERGPDEDVGPHPFAEPCGQPVDHLVHAPEQEEHAPDADDDGDQDDEDAIGVAAAEEGEQRGEHVGAGHGDHESGDDPQDQRGTRQRSLLEGPSPRRRIAGRCAHAGVILSPVRHGEGAAASRPLPPPYHQRGCAWL